MSICLDVLHFILPWVCYFTKKIVCVCMCNYCLSSSKSIYKTVYFLFFFLKWSGSTVIIVEKFSFVYACRLRKLILLSKHLNLLINFSPEFYPLDLAFICVLSFCRSKEKVKCFLKYK